MDDDELDDEATAEGDERARRLAKGIRPALDGMGEDLAKLTEDMADHQLALWPTAPVDLDDEPEALAARNGAGRPQGSRNRATVEAADWILSRFRSPLAFLAQVYTRPAKLLARELGCETLEAFKLQQAAALGLAPYVHRKQPLAVEIGDGDLPLMMIVRPDQADRLERGELTIEDLAMEIVEDQGVSEADDDQSDSDQSDGEAK